MEIYGYIYKITNDINNKFYIGQTIHDIKFRFDRHIKDSTTKKNPLNTHFARAIRKYGAEHFHMDSTNLYVFEYKFKAIVRHSIETLEKLEKEKNN